MDHSTRHIRQKFLSSLELETSISSAAAQSMRHIAVVELSQNLWPDPLTHLVRNSYNLLSTEMCKATTLEAVGYICQDIDSWCPEEKFKDILRAILHSMRNEPS